MRTAASFNDTSAFFTAQGQCLKDLHHFRGAMSWQAIEKQQTAVLKLPRRWVGCRHHYCWFHPVWCGHV